MSEKVFDCIVATSKYQDNTGAEKRRWKNIGAIFSDKDQQGKKYFFMLLDRSFSPAGVDAPVGSDSLRVTLTTPKQKNYASQNNYANQNFAANNQARNNQASTNYSGQDDWGNNPPEEISDVPF